jgi:hypothetical protein
MSATVIAPEGEFPLGAMQEDDRIFLQFSGARLAAVRLVKTSDERPQTAPHPAGQFQAQ